MYACSHATPTVASAPSLPTNCSELLRSVAAAVCVRATHSSMFETQAHGCAIQALQQAPRHRVPAYLLHAQNITCVWALTRE